MAYATSVKKTSNEKQQTKTWNEMMNNDEYKEYNDINDNSNNYKDCSNNDNEFTLVKSSKNKSKDDLQKNIRFFVKYINNDDGENKISDAKINTISCNIVNCLYQYVKESINDTNDNTNNINNTNNNINKKKNNNNNNNIIEVKINNENETHFSGDKSKYGLVLGVKRKTLNTIMHRYNVNISVPLKNNPDNLIIIKGETSNRVNALNSIINILLNH